MKYCSCSIRQNLSPRFSENGTIVNSFLFPIAQWAMHLVAHIKVPETRDPKFALLVCSDSCS